jgi:hypothetical protein
MGCNRAGWMATIHSGAGDPACMQALRLVVYVTLWSGGHTLLACI